MADIIINTKDLVDIKEGVVDKNGTLSVGRANAGKELRGFVVSIAHNLKPTVINRG